MDELIGEFFLDTQTHIESIEEILLRFEREEDQEELIDDIFRRVHSIKGNAGVLGISPIHIEGQKFESFLEGVRERKTATPDELDTMFNGLDALKAVVAEVKGEKAPGDTNKSHESHEHVEQPQVENIPAPITAPPAIKVSAPPAAPTGSALKIPVISMKPVEKPVAKSSASDLSELFSKANRQMTKSDNVTFLTFDLAGERYGLEIMKVREIILKENSTPVPNTKHFVDGVMNLRDQVIPVFDLKKKLDIVDESGTEEKNIIIVEISKVTTGLKVDEVTGIVTFRASEITTPDKLRGSVSADYIYGMGNTENGTVILLNASDLCNPDELLY